MNAISHLVLTNGALEAELMPHRGARLCRLSAKRPHADDVDLVVPLRDWDAPEHGWPKAGAYPLIPYSNRIADARLAFDGAIHTLEPHPLDWPNTLHGHAQRRAWDVHAHDSQRAELVFDETASAHWPWPFEARIVFALRDQALDMSFALRNTGSMPMPAGLGWHPFFATDCDTTIRFDAPRRWELDDRFLPTGHSTVAPHATTLTRDDWRDGDCALYASEWNGAANAGVCIERRAGTLRLSANPALTHLVIYAPRGGALCCVEPVSHLANGFNLAARGVAGTGMRTLAPGESWHARVTLVWEPKP
ncbi:aldose epimerase family protein [Paraburkholderia fungorum]